MDPRQQLGILPRSLFLLEQSSHVHLQEPQIDSRLVALKEVAEDITVYNILMTWPCGPGLMECIDDCPPRMVHSMQILYRLFDQDDGIKDLTDTLCQRLVELERLKKNRAKLERQKKKREAGTSERRKRIQETDRPRL
jgi:hypothetical protein